MEQKIKDSLKALRLNATKKNEHEELLEQSKKCLKKERCVLSYLYITLSHEKQDVEQLEKLSLTSIYHSIVGDKREKLNFEQQEFLIAKLKYDKCQNTINKLIKDNKQHQNIIDKCDEIERDHINFLKDQSELTTEQTKLVKSIEKLTQLKVIKIELQKTIKIGAKLKKKLKQAHTIMRSAGNWGMADMLGGGLITTAVKYRKINNGKEQLEEINNLMVKLNQELSKVNKSSNTPLTINITAFNTFSDYFIDGLLFDWMVQSKINKSINTIKYSMETTDLVQTHLYKKLDATNKQLQTLN